MITLTIDTTRAEATVMLRRGQVILGKRQVEILPTLSRSLLGAIEELLVQQNLLVGAIDRIVVAAGPAVRTSALRAGVTVANLLAYAGGAELQEASLAGNIGFVVPRY